MSRIREKSYFTGPVLLNILEISYPTKNNVLLDHIQGKGTNLANFELFDSRDKNENNL